MYYIISWQSAKRYYLNYCIDLLRNQIHIYAMNELEQKIKINFINTGINIACKIQSVKTNANNVVVIFVYGLINTYV